jgi:hypothetical protein
MLLKSVHVFIDGIFRILNARPSKQAFRDFKIKNYQHLLADKILDEVDCRPKNFSIPDQKETGFCTAFAFSTCVEYQTGHRPSEQFSYALGAERDSWADTLPYATGGGSDGKSVLDGARKVGMIQNYQWRFDYPPKYYIGDGDKLLANAVKWKIKGYVALDLKDIETCLRWLATGRPIYVGVAVDSNYCNVNSNGIMANYNPARVEGGHQLVIGSYKKTRGDKPFSFDGSWGENHGDNGRVYVSAKDLEQSVMDAYGIIF